MNTETLKGEKVEKRVGGRFVVGTCGGPGRGKGNVSKPTLLAHRLRALMVEHGTEDVPDGKGGEIPRILKALDTLYAESVGEYCGLMCKVVPRELLVEDAREPRDFAAFMLQITERQAAKPLSADDDGDGSLLLESDGETQTALLVATG
jgi:hypothetical protein